MAVDTETRQETIGKIWRDNRFLWFLPGLVFGFLIGLPLHLADAPTDWFIEGIWPETLGILFTVFLIDRLSERRERAREERELQVRLVREAGSPDNATALNAVREMQDRSWLKGEKGLLKGAKLLRANLAGAELLGANLQQVSLWGADLQAAELKGVDLQKAGLIRANLQGASLLAANLEGANLLAANLQEVKLFQAKLNNKTVLPDGVRSYTGVDNPAYTPDSYYQPGLTDMGKYTDPNHPDFWQPDWVKDRQEDAHDDKEG